MKETKIPFFQAKLEPVIPRGMTNFELMKEFKRLEIEKIQATSGIHFAQSELPDEFVERYQDYFVVSDSSLPERHVLECTIPITDTAPEDWLPSGSLKKKNFSVERLGKYVLPARRKRIRPSPPPVRSVKEGKQETRGSGGSDIGESIFEGIKGFFYLLLGGRSD